jgi:hypothetical protein
MILADMWWLVALVILTVSVKDLGEFQVGAVAAIVVYLWSRHRKARKDDWFDDIERQDKLRSIAEDEEANP